MKTYSYFSLKYGVLSPDAILAWASAAGYARVCLTDINSTGAVLAFVRAAQHLGIKAIVGAEIRNGMDIKATVIAKDNDGLLALNNFLTKHIHGNLPFDSRLPDLVNCFIFYPLTVHFNDLKPNEFFQVRYTDLNNISINFKHVLPEKIVALDPMIFRNKRDFNTHRLLRAIHYNTLLSKLPKKNQANENERFLSTSDLSNVYQYFPQYLERTQALFDTCHVDFEFGEQAKPQNPTTYTGSVEEDEEMLRQLCADGLAYRYPIITDEIIARIEKEIEIIAQKDYLSYFLMAWDFTSFARSKHFFYVGRGSGANSIVAYLLRITDVDPLELDLYFERFINLYRKNPPDFDIDFSWRDRDEVIDYIFQRYPNAAWLCTYNTFQYRATIRELGKVFGLPKTEIDKLSRSKLPTANLDELSKLVLRYSAYIQGIPSHLSVHSGGIVVSEKPITWYSATFLPPKGYPTTQFSMMEAEDVGLYKFDVLSQRGLGKIRECLDIIAYNQAENPPHDIHDIAYFKEDESIRSLMLEAKALGCFYVESPAMRMLMIKLKVKTYLELVAASSIIRPGVSQSGMMREYILRHRNPDRRKEANPILLEMMPETYGVMVYQEDVIKVAHYFAGLSLAEADVLRRGMSGKFRSRDEFQAVRDLFFSNCAKKGYDLVLVGSIWSQIESFAGYAFSKGHSASYAVESYQSLYLKAHYPLEYMTATINNFGGYYRTEIYVHEARRFGALVEAPSINEGDYASVLIGKRLILGFNLVDGMEVKCIRSILKERIENGLFRNFDDLMQRLSIPLEQLSLLIRIGALRDFLEDRKTLLWKAHLYLNKSTPKSKQNSLFSAVPMSFNLPNFEEGNMECSFEQIELMGFPLCNPFDLLANPLPKHTLAKQIVNSLGLVIELVGYLVAVKPSKTSKGTLMNFGTFIDVEGDTIDTVHFPEAVRKYPFMGKGIYRMKGRVTEEFGYYSLEVGQMEKLRLIDDVRFGEEATISNLG